MSLVHVRNHTEFQQLFLRVFYRSLVVAPRIVVVHDSWLRQGAIVSTPSQLGARSHRCCRSAIAVELTKREVFVAGADGSHLMIMNAECADKCDDLAWDRRLREGVSGEEDKRRNCGGIDVEPVEVETIAASKGRREMRRWTQGTVHRQGQSPALIFSPAHVRPLQRR